MRTFERPRIVLLADFEEHSAREVCLGAAQYAAQHNLAFEPWSMHARSFPSRPEFRGIGGLLLTEGASNLIFGSKPRITIPHAFVLGRSLSAGAPSVELDEAAIGRMAAEHLLQRGYRNLVSMASSTLDWSRRRVRGFQKECKQRGVSVTHHHIPEEILPAYWQPNCLGKNEVLHRIVCDLPKPCGIFAMNDVAACFIIETARACKIKIPQQMGIIGADNDLIPNAAAGLSISSVEPPFRALGWQAALILDRRRKGEKISMRTILPPIRTVVRTSTDAFMVEDGLVRKAQAYIENYRNGSILVSQAAKAAGTTSVTLGKHFREHLGVNPSEYILRRRIEHAKDLLRQGKLNVEEVSNTCGFHSCSYFCQIFKRVTEATPGSFR